MKLLLNKACQIGIGICTLIVVLLLCILSFMRSYTLSEVNYFNVTDAQAPYDRQHKIPKVIHQTWKNEQIPEGWKKAVESWKSLPNYTYILWTDKDCLDFIEINYSWFIETYNNYPYNIQRIDAVRYFILYHYGGIYVDMDKGCQLFPDLLLEPAIMLQETIPFGLTNDVMGAAPRHPFFQHVIDGLIPSNHFYGLNYLTVMFSTGPLFLTERYNTFPHKSDIKIIAPKLEYTLWTQWGGSTWHGGDGKLIAWIYYNQTLCFLILYSCVVLLCGLVKRSEEHTV